MPPELIKLFGPVVFLSVFSVMGWKYRKACITGPLFYVSCFVAMSSNFSFIYRQAFQSIQVILILSALFVLINRRRVNSINGVFIVCILLILSSVAFSHVDSYSISQTVNFFSIVGVFNYLIVFLDTKERMLLFVRYIGLLSFVSACLAIIEYMHGQVVRVEATFSNPNYLSFFLGIGFCIISVQQKNTFYWVKLAVIFIVIVMTGSRAGLIFPLIMLAWNIYKDSGNARLVIKVPIGIAVIAALVVSGATRFSDVDNTSGSDAERLIFARIAFEMANDNPVSGVGWGRFPLEFSAYASTADVVLTSHGNEIDVSGQDLRVTHNDLARILAELGYTGFILFSALSFRLLICALRVSKNEYAFVFPVWAGIFLFSLTHNNLNSLMFWFFFLLPMLISIKSDLRLSTAQV